MKTKEIEQDTERYRTLLSKIRNKTITKKEQKEFSQLVQKWQKETDKIKLENKLTPKLREKTK